ncbi:CRISPR-associated helicase Cas3' [Amycolatopsis anabasis]|uniref:CRISPR-associated helicase Cas3' n=1 Tax=Amycolatopsis anabasis TaxID=1840409 RepID=UPI00131B14B1|nr:CRISPR-associated helicase Cas3' [Amycolatopsis anabasis]
MTESPSAPLTPSTLLSAIPLGTPPDPLTRVLAKHPTQNTLTGHIGEEQLTTHSLATLNTAYLVWRRVGAIADQPKRFWTWVLIAAFLHDTGKLPDGFQQLLRSGRAWRQRHEVYSLGFVALLLAALPERDRFWIGTAVAAHHRPFTTDSHAARRAVFTQYGKLDLAEFLNCFHPVDPATAAALLSWCGDILHSHGLLPTRSPAFGETVDVDELGAAAFDLLRQLHTHWFNTLFGQHRADGVTGRLLQGAVVLADHVASADGDLLTEPPLRGYHTTFAYTLARTGAHPYPHQTLAATVHGHVIIRASTGLGKTETGQLWAETNADAISAACGGIPRVFYLLPYLASINAIADRLATDVGQDVVGVLHSRAGLYHLDRADPEQARDEAAEQAVSKQQASRNHRELLRVATPYQLLRAALSGPTNAATLLDTVNSVFIFDELHAYEPRRLGMILAMMTWWADHGGRVAILSATLPGPLTRMLTDEVLADQTVRVIDAPKAQPRHRLHLTEDHLTSPASLETIARDLDTGQPVFVIANNIADARLIYDALAPRVTRRWGEPAAFLLHARFRGLDRRRIENGILDRFGASTAAARAQPPGLVVATQVLEVSLNLDGAILHTSGAPLEALLQRFGRINRLGLRAPAPVIVHAPLYRPRGNSKTLYADGVYDEEPTRRTWDLLTTHDNAVIDEADLQHWLDTVYTGDWAHRWETDVRKARTEFTNTFLAFARPFHELADLEKHFATMFDGIEAVWRPDLEHYTAALHSTDTTAAGRLLASEFLIPLPAHQIRNLERDPATGVLVFDGDYNPVTGLGDVTGRVRYNPGELI